MVLLLEGALILLAGILIGIGLGRLRARRKDPKPVKAVCGCTHHYSMHDPKTGECAASVKVTRYNAVGGHVGYEYLACACLRYTGPEPMPAYYAPEIATEESQ